MEPTSAAEQIDAIINRADDWRGQTLARLRAIITAADAELVEEIKWRKPSRPEGVPVWSHGGIVCVADLLKSAVRLTFPGGAQLPDPLGLFNARLDSKTVRAIDFFVDVEIPAAGLTQLVRAASELNASKSRSR